MLQFSYRACTSSHTAEALAARIGAAAVLVLLLDYDGTLVPFAPMPELAEPDDELMALLRDLAGPAEHRDPHRERSDRTRRSSAGSAPSRSDSTPSTAAVAPARRDLRVGRRGACAPVVAPPACSP